MELARNAFEKRWTWADLLSSYRFWGLSFYFSFLLIGHQIFIMSASILMRDHFQLTNAEMGSVFSISQVGILLGIIPAWVASRLKNHYSLYFFSCFFLLGIALFCFNLQNIIIMMLAEVFVFLSISAVLLIIPAFISSAVRSVEAFVLSFGLMATMKFIGASSLSGLFSVLFGHEPNTFFISIASLVAISTLFLVPIKKCLFNEAPPIRQVEPKSPEYQNPAVTFFLFLIPFYFVFWLVRIHREIRTFTQSPTLLTPSGAGWCVFLVPFCSPVIFSILNDNLSLIIKSQGKTTYYPTWLIILLLFVCPPLSAAMVQSQMNQLS